MAGPARPHALWKMAALPPPDPAHAQAEQLLRARQQQRLDEDRARYEARARRAGGVELNAPSLRGSAAAGTSPYRQALPSTSAATPEVVLSPTPEALAAPATCGLEALEGELVIAHMQARDWEARCVELQGEVDKAGARAAAAEASATAWEEKFAACNAQLSAMLETRGGGSAVDAERRCAAMEAELRETRALLAASRASCDAAQAALTTARPQAPLPDPPQRGAPGPAPGLPLPETDVEQFLERLYGVELHDVPSAEVERELTEVGGRDAMDYPGCVQVARTLDACGVPDLRAGDLLVAVDGVEIASAAHLAVYLMASGKPWGGAAVPQLTVRRGRAVHATPLLLRKVHGGTGMPGLAGFAHGCTGADTLKLCRLAGGLARLLYAHKVNAVRATDNAAITVAAVNAQKEELAATVCGLASREAVAMDEKKYATARVTALLQEAALIKEGHLAEKAALQAQADAAAADAAKLRDEAAALRRQLDLPADAGLTSSEHDDPEKAVLTMRLKRALEEKLALTEELVSAHAARAPASVRSGSTASHPVSPRPSGQREGYIKALEARCSSLTRSMKHGESGGGGGVVGMLEAKVGYYEDQLASQAQKLEYFEDEARVAGELAEEMELEYREELLELEIEVDALRHRLGMKPITRERRPMKARLPGRGSFSKLPRAASVESPKGSTPTTPLPHRRTISTSASPFSARSPASSPRLRGLSAEMLVVLPGSPTRSAPGSPAFSTAFGEMVGPDSIVIASLAEVASGMEADLRGWCFDLAARVAGAMGRVEVSLAKLSAQAQAAARDNRDLKARLAPLQEQVERYKAQLVEADATAAANAGALDEAREALMDQMEELRELVNEVEMLQEEKAAQTTRIGEVEAQLRTAHLDRVRNEEFATERATTVEERVARLEGIEADLQAEVAGLQARNAALQAQGTSDAAALDLAQEELQKTMEYMMDLKRSEDAAKAALAAAEDSNASLEDAKRELEAKVTALQGELDAAKTIEVAVLSAEHAAMSQELEAHKQSNATLASSVLQLNQKLVSFEAASDCEAGMSGMSYSEVLDGHVVHALSRSATDRAAVVESKPSTVAVDLDNLPSGDGSGGGVVVRLRSRSASALKPQQEAEDPPQDLAREATRSSATDDTQDIIVHHVSRSGTGVRYPSAMSIPSPDVFSSMRPPPAAAATPAAAAPPAAAWQTVVQTPPPALRAAGGMVPSTRGRPPPGRLNSLASPVRDTPFGRHAAGPLRGYGAAGAVAPVGAGGYDEVEVIGHHDHIVVDHTKESQTGEPQMVGTAVGTASPGRMFTAAMQGSLAAGGVAPSPAGVEARAAVLAATPGRRGRPPPGHTTTTIAAKMAGAL